MLDLPSHLEGSTQLSPISTSPSGQKHPSAHPPSHVELIFSHDCWHNGPHSWYTIPSGQSGAEIYRLYGIQTCLFAVLFTHGWINDSKFCD